MSEEKFEVVDFSVYGPHGPIAEIFPQNSSTYEGARASRKDKTVALAKLLNSAEALLEKLYDNPTLFFGMEDTCIDEVDDLRSALAAIGSQGDAA